MARTDPQVNFRIPLELKESLETAAMAAKRTVPAELVARLQASFQNTHSPDTAALQQEIKYLQALLEATKQVSKVTEITQNWLADILVKVIDTLPEKTQPSYRHVRLLANSMATNDTRGLGQALLAIFAGDETVTGNLKQQLQELEPAIAAKERGEDLTPYREADIKRERERMTLSQKEIPVMVRGKKKTIKMDSYTPDK